MSDHVVDGHDFDELVGQEWDAFQVALGDHLASLQGRVCFEVHSYGHEAALMVITRRSDGGAYHLTVPAASRMSFDVAQRIGLRELDLELESGSETWKFNGVPSPDQVAWAAVTLCRDALPWPRRRCSRPATRPCPHQTSRSSAPAAGPATTDHGGEPRGACRRDRADRGRVDAGGVYSGRVRVHG